MLGMDILYDTDNYIDERINVRFSLTGTTSSAQNSVPTYSEKFR